MSICDKFKKLLPGKARQKLTCIVITGLPGTGKTTLTDKIAAALRLPVISKDLIKETIFDELGYSDRAYSKKVGQAARSLLFKYADDFLKRGVSLVLESNFKAELDNQIFRELIKRYQPQVIQILCFADGAVLFERFKRRALSGKRHPGHADSNNLIEWESALLPGKCPPLDLGGELMELDTTDLARVNINQIIQRLKKFI